VDFEYGVNIPLYSIYFPLLIPLSDVTFGVHDVAVQANIVTRQVGPLLANGSAEYLYLGCGRNLQKQYNIASNENGVCQTTCFNAGYKFAGTEYRTFNSAQMPVLNKANEVQIPSAGFVLLFV
jgi:iron transport multicopper oxidase